jgi:hypothetical protein
MFIGFLNILTIADFIKVYKKATRQPDKCT